MSTTDGNVVPIPSAALARLEHRLAEAGEQRVLILRDAVGDFVANELEQRDQDIVELKSEIENLRQILAEQQAVTDRLPAEIADLRSEVAGPTAASALIPIQQRYGPLDCTRGLVRGTGVPAQAIGRRGNFSQS